MLEFLFRNKKTPRPIFAGLKTDMHCHLLPMVDDGSKGMEESISCLQTMERLGYRRVYLTPHFQYPRFDNREEDILRLYEDFKQQVSNAGLKIEVAGIGGEYRLDPDFLERKKGTKLLTIGDDNTMDAGYLLVELSLQHKFPGMLDIIRELQQEGYVVVLAHPERYPYLNMGGREIAALKEMGVLLQVNVLSLDGFYGEGVRKKAEYLLTHNYVEMLGSDTHNVLYAQGLVHASNNRKIEKLISNNNFLNIDL